MTWTRNTRRSIALTLAVSAPLLGGAKGDGCAASSESPAPDVTGVWAIEYDDSLTVEITIGGSVYEETVGAAGGTIEITHDGHPLTFDLDCERPEVICPSEAWPETVDVEQRNQQFEHRMIVTLPEQQCDGTLVEPAAGECGPETLNPDCDQVCDGTITIVERERFGVIGEDGESFRLYLGAGIATNGINCALLGVSLADATLVNSGEAGDDDWRAIEMDGGLVTVGYAGVCLWAGDPDMDSELEALLLGASVKFTTGFTGQRQAEPSS